MDTKNNIEQEDSWLNLKISRQLHHRLKEYCKANGGVNLRIVVERAVSKFIKKPLI